MSFKEDWDQASCMKKQKPPVLPARGLDQLSRLERTLLSLLSCLKGLINVGRRVLERNSLWGLGRTGSLLEPFVNSI